MPVPPTGAPQPGANPAPTPTNTISTSVCPSCGLAGNWPAPSPRPNWPVEFACSCHSCKASLTLKITGYAPQRPEVTALERALKPPPARGR
jgi:hypothetical protein